jgi:hypothetical protein
VIARLRGRRAKGPQAHTAPLLGELKLRAIDHAFERLGSRSLADLGGVWAVDGGYALYAADRHSAERVVICDDDFTEPLLSRAARDPRVELAEGNFGGSEAVAAVGQVDAILLFDVLLHQVRPDWDEILELYGPATRSFVLAGPWWNGERTERLVELGRDRYLAAVPSEPIYEEIWERLDEHNPRRGRLWRDCHDIWQWGITEADLTATLERMGFELSHREQAGAWMGLSDFDDIAFVYTRPTS